MCNVEFVPTHRIDAGLEAPLILHRLLLLRLPPDVGVHVFERRRGGGGRRRGRPAVPARRRRRDVGPPQLVEVREDLVVRRAELLRVARGEAQQVIIAGLKRGTTEGKGSKSAAFRGKRRSRSD